METFIFQREVSMLGDPELKKCKVGDIIQLQRRGFFRVDNAYAPPSVHSGKASPVILFEIPDGHQKTPAPANNAKANAAKAPAVAIVPNPTGNLGELIECQGNLVRKLKAEKVEKSVLDREINRLVSLKDEYKIHAGIEWKPDPTKPACKKIAQISEKCGNSEDMSSDPIPEEYQKQTRNTTSTPIRESERDSEIVDLNLRITNQGNIIRDMKARKEAKSQIDAAVKTLLNLKAEFKSKSGKDWLPGAIAPAVKPIAVATQSGDIIDKIVKQGDLVRDLKTKKADKAAIDAEVKALLALKAEYKAQTGQDYKPGAVAPKKEVSPPANNSNKATEVNDQIAKQGNVVRDLKTQKADKATIDAEVKKLLALKAEFKTLTGSDWKPGAAPSNVSCQSFFFSYLFS